MKSSVIMFAAFQLVVSSQKPYDSSVWFHNLLNNPRLIFDSKNIQKLFSNFSNENIIAAA